MIVFKNERKSVILRTVYSVIHRSPKHLLKEILLIDDDSEIGKQFDNNKYSDRFKNSNFQIEEVKKPLQDYCEQHFGEIVKIIRTPERLGLIAGRNFGVKQATADVVVLLDAHCEATDGW